MTEEHLHRDIVAYPDDDQPRLRYADWLTAGGQVERAEFIRTQLVLAALPADDPGRAGLEAREQELLAAHQDEWLRPVREAIDDWVFHRGMLGVSTGVSKFLDHACHLTRSPGVHYVDIVDHAVGRESVLALAACPYLARATILNLAGWYCHDPEHALVDDEQTAALAGSPFVAGLEVLNLGCNAVRNDGVRALAASPHLTRLEELHLRANLFGDDGVAALAGSTALAGLVTLDLSFNDGRVTEAGWRGLATGRGLPQLGWLGLGGNRIGGEVAELLRTRFGDRVAL